MSTCLGYILVTCDRERNSLITRGRDDRAHAPPLAIHTLNTREDEQEAAVHVGLLC